MANALLTGFELLIAGGRSLLVLGGYHKDGLMDDLMEAIAAITLNGSRDFVFLADWNETEDTVRKSPWLGLLKARVLAPADARPTCWAAEAGSAIDFAIVSARVEHLARLETVQEVPWSPHAALRLSIQRAPQSWRVLAPRRPAKLPEAVVAHEQVESWRGLRPAEKWRAVAQPQWKLEAKAPSEALSQECWRHATAMGTADAAWVLGGRLGRWIAQFEEWTIMEAGFGWKDPKADAHRGRGAIPQMCPESPQPWQTPEWGVGGSVGS